MVEGGLKLAALRPLELHFAAVVDAERARLLAVGEDRLELGQSHVGAVLGDESAHGIAPAAAARLADEGKRRFVDVR